MKDQIIGLRTLNLNSALPSFVDTPQRAIKKRVFTEDEWKFLNGLPTEELHRRVAYGDMITGLLSRPEMMNMTPARAAAISSNMRFQQEAIREIIKARGV